MMEGLTDDDLFAALSEKEVEDGCRYLLTADYSGGKDDKLNALKFAAQLRRFRLDFLKRRTTEQNLPTVMQAVRHVDAHSLRPNVVKAWLVGNHRPLLCAFLAAADIPQDDGFVDGEPAPPSVENFRRAVNEITAQFDRRVVAIYLGYQLVHGNEFWANLLPAVTPDKMVPLSEAAAEHAAQPVPQPAVEDMVPPAAEDSVAFTTLDNLLIQKAVAVATSEIGAISEDQLEDLIEEVMALNSKRQHSVFHRGFFHALFGREPEFTFPGENSSRRIWYFSGVLMGLMRGINRNRVLEILHKQNEPNPLYPRPSVGADAEGLKKRILIITLRRKTGDSAPDRPERTLSPSEPPLSPALRWGGSRGDEKAISSQSLENSIPPDCRVARQVA